MNKASQQLATAIAPAMFGLSLLFVALLSMLIVLWVDIPRVAELGAIERLGEVSPSEQLLVENTSKIDSQIRQHNLVKLADPIAKVVRLALLIIWPLFWLEFAISHRNSDGQSITKNGGYFRLLACAVPPLRIAAPSAAWEGKIWLPHWGWCTPGKTLGRNLEMAFSAPMLLIALLILPILLIEYGLHSMVEAHQWLRVLLHVCTGFIWGAFTLEFLVMISATDKRIQYIKAHWIDLAIILLPLISFLRTFRVLRLARLAQVQKVAKMGRVFRVRGLATKLLRSLMLFGFISRLLRITPEKKLAKLQRMYTDQLDDLNTLKAQIDELDAQISNSKKV